MRELSIEREMQYVVTKGQMETCDIVVQIGVQENMQVVQNVQNVQSIRSE